MTQENDKTLEDLEQIKNRAQEDLDGLDELAEINPEYADDILALHEKSISLNEVLGEIAEKMQEETEALDGDGN